MKLSSNLTQGSFEHISNCCGESVDKVLISAMEKESMDNLSVVIITFPNFTRFLESVESQQGKVSGQRNRTSQNQNKSSTLPPTVPIRTDQNVNTGLEAQTQ